MTVNTKIPLPVFECPFVWMWAVSLCSGWELCAGMATPGARCFLTAGAPQAW